MKRITAIIQPHMLSKVLHALHTCEHFPGVTVSDCEGDGRGRGPGGHYVTLQETLFMKEHKQIDLFCSDEVCDLLVEMIQKAAHTGNNGDGIIAVSELTHVVRIHSGQEQDQAL